MPSAAPSDCTPSAKNSNARKMTRPLGLAIWAARRPILTSRKLGTNWGTTRASGPAAAATVPLRGLGERRSVPADSGLTRPSDAVASGQAAPADCGLVSLRGACRLAPRTVADVGRVGLRRPAPAASAGNLPVPRLLSQASSFAACVPKRFPSQSCC